MSDHPRTDQEQWAADWLRLLGFDIKMNYWPADTPQRMEIDIWGRLGPLQVAVECKKYSRDEVGAEQIEYFHQKLELLGNTLGIFIANSYSRQDLSLCRRFGLLPLTSQTILDEIAKINRSHTAKKHLVVSIATWQLLAALMRFVQDWQEYLDPDWPFHNEIYVTTAFERQGLIQTRRGDFGDFGYEHTETGLLFFSQLRNLGQLLESENISAMDHLEQAARLVINACNFPAEADTFQGYDRLVIQGLGLQDIQGNPTSFGQLFAAVLEDAISQSPT